MSELREQVRRNNTRGRHLSTQQSGPVPEQDALPLDGASPATVYGPDGRPVTILAEPAVLGGEHR